jgi:hypothetical protein
MSLAFAVERYDGFQIRSSSSRNFHWDANLTSLSKLKRAQLNEPTPTLFAFVQLSHNRSRELSTALGNQTQSCGLRVSTEHVRKTVDEVSSNNKAVGNKAERTITFLSDINQQV